MGMSDYIKLPIDVTFGGHNLTTIEGMSLMGSWTVAVRASNNRVYLIGNGASAATASHYGADAMKQLGVKTHVLHDPAYMTAAANDFGYDKSFSWQLLRYLDREDMLIAISGSGESENIVSALEAAKCCHVHRIVTLTGKRADNRVRKLGALDRCSIYGQ